MSDKPRLLDLFCGGGGAGMGYYRAGFEVVGVDIAPQKHYPFEFHQGDALDYAAAHGHEFDAIHASPPCQRYSVVTRTQGTQDNHPDLIPLTRFWLQTIGKPYVIENVGGARKHLKNPFMLCGTYFGLKVYRHRYFESDCLIFTPQHEPHRDQTPSAGHGTGAVSRQWNKFTSPNGFLSVAGHFSQVEYAKYAMGIDWLGQKGLGQAIPPAYTEYIGKQLINFVLTNREKEIEHGSAKVHA